MPFFTFTSRASFVLLIALSSVACSAGDDSSPTSSVQERSAKDKWDALGWSHYSFEFETGGFDPHQHVRITVTAGRVTAVESMESGTIVGGLDGYPTIPSLFARIDAATGLDSAEGLLTDATYDETAGFPSAARFRNASENWSFSVTTVKQIP